VNIESSQNVPTERDVHQELSHFYFIVVFWGERFRKYLCKFCLPSLLAQGNIPSLEKNLHNKFIFCTPTEDWDALKRAPVFSHLTRYIEPFHIEIPRAPQGKVGCEHMGIGHKLASELAYRDQAFGVFLTPDLMLSDGTIRFLQNQVLKGYKGVLVPALRLGEEPLFQAMKTQEIIPEDDTLLESGGPIIFSGRQMVKASLESFHSETQRYEWEKPFFTNFPCACWWKVPGEEGLVLHSLSWAPLLIDYKAIGKHDTSTFELWTLDGDYVFNNFENKLDELYVVRDSDEIMMISWAPLLDRPQSLRPNLLKRIPILGEMVRGSILRAALLSGIFDSLKQRLFFLPVRWHSMECSKIWDVTENKASQVLFSYLADLAESLKIPGHEMSENQSKWVSSDKPGVLCRKVYFPLLGFGGRVWMVGSEFYQYRHRLWDRLVLGIRGDKNARARIFRRLRIVSRLLRGAPVNLSE